MTTINGIFESRFAKKTMNDIDIDIDNDEDKDVKESNNALTTETGIPGGAAGDLDWGRITRLETALSVGFTQTTEVGMTLTETSHLYHTDLDDYVRRNRTHAYLRR